ncbi:MAG: indole-3-glycerol phosphate synthase TrpC [Oscillospiraceae bacterium]|jgi:indole-3-glycerol phosphate synthase
MEENILQKLAAHARERVEEKKRAEPTERIRERALAMGGETGFPFEKALRGPKLAFICECKRASPSRGLLAPDFPYVALAREYEAAGAAAVSVLTEPKWFLGRDECLREISEAVALPCLRKDFVVEEYMLYESKTLGAAAVLLICTLLDEERLRRYIKICDELGLSALVEAHDEAELQTAVRAGARVIGVNNRDLKDFSVDLGNSRRLCALAPAETIFVAESGIRTAADVAALRACGADAVLVGEAMVCAPDKAAKLWELRGAL